MKTKKLLSAFLALLMLLTCCSLGAFSLEPEEGDNYTWSFDEASATLTVTGTGALTYTDEGDNGPIMPWDDIKYDIRHVVIGEGITEVGSYAFYCDFNIETISLPTTVTKIGACAFYACTSLTSINIPEGVTELPEVAFACCGSLTELTLPSTLVTIDGYCFIYSDIQKIILPDNVKTIGEAAFADTLLEEITIGTGIQEIGMDAFNLCPLQKITNLSETYNVIRMQKNYDDEDESILQAFPNVDIIKVAHRIYLLELAEELPDITQEDIAEYEAKCIADFNAAAGTDFTDVDSCEDYVFNCVEDKTAFPDWLTVYCYKNSAEQAACEEHHVNYQLLTDDKCGDNITWSFDEASGTLTLTGTGMTYNYSNIKSGNSNLPPWTDLNKKIHKIIVEEGITGIGGNTFSSTYAEEIVLPSTVNYIFGQAFAFSKYLQKINIPEGVTELSHGPFYECPSLQQVTLPKTLKIIGPFCFSYSGIRKLDVPNGVTSIAYSAFERSCLQEIKIPASITEIDEVFEFCPIRKIVNLSRTAVVIRTFQQHKEIYYIGINYSDWDFVKLYFDYTFNKDLEIYQRMKTLGITEDDEMYTQLCDEYNSEYYEKFVNYAGDEKTLDKYCKDFLAAFGNRTTGFAPWLEVECYKDSAEHNACIQYGVTHTIIETPGYDCKCGLHHELFNDVVPATCTEVGYGGGSACDLCDTVITNPIETINPLGHIDSNNDGLCDRCRQKTENGGSSTQPSEKTSIRAYFKQVANTLIEWFRRLFGLLK